MAKRKDSSGWKANKPASGSSTSDWKEWAKGNPNRSINASARKQEAKKQPTTMSKEGTEARKKVVAKWKAARPISGKGSSKTDQDKAVRRQQMKDWAKWNPNKADNAARATKGKKK
jgi:hypothetical protein